MAIYIEVTDNDFIINDDDTHILTKDKHDIFLTPSNSDSTIVEIYETSPQESARNIIYSSKYTNFATPTGSTAVQVISAINDLIVNAPEISIVANTIDITNDNASNVTSYITWALGAGSAKTLYISSAGVIYNPSTNQFSTNGNNFILTTSDLIKSDVANKSQIDFGIGGDEFNLYTDGSAAAESGLSIAPGGYYMYCPNGFIRNTGSLTSITDLSEIRLNSPIVSLASGSHLTSQAGNILIGLGVTGGEYFEVTTDAGAGLKQGLYLDPSPLVTYQVQLWESANNYLKIGASKSLLAHDTLLELNSPIYRFTQLTATTVPYIDASKNLISSSVTPTELGYLSGVTSAIQTQLNLLASLASPTFTGNVTLNSNVTYSPTVNSSLSGANQRIPSHTTANIVFTNAGLTSIGSANNGGVSGGHTLCITNETGASIIIVNNYGSAAAGEAIFTGVSGDQTLPNHASIWLQYDATGSCWTCVNGGLIPITTGVSGLGTGVATWLATPSSANLSSAITDETGTGALVFSTSPTLVTPVLGTPTSGNLTNCTGLRDSIQIGIPAFNPVDSTTYYFGAANAAAANTTDGAFALTIAKAGTIKAIMIDLYNGGTLGSAETSTWRVRINSTNTTISSTVTTNATVQHFSNTSMSVAVAANDTIQIAFDAPAYATNPTTIRGNVLVYIES